MSESIKIRDRRNKGWFWVDNEIIDTYGKYIGPLGIAVYLSLCRHADVQSQWSFPSQETIAMELGISSRCVRDYLLLLQKIKMIKKERHRDIVSKRWISNTYALLDQSQWAKPSELGSYGKRNVVPKSHRNVVPTKETQGRRRLKEGKDKLLEKMKFGRVFSD